MSGTKAGGIQAAKTNIANEPKFYKRIGARGGAASNTGGFYVRRDLARAAGRIGGLTGRKGYKPKSKAKLAHDKRFREAYANLIRVQEEAREERAKNA